jgi:hypothetical protein
MESLSSPPGCGRRSSKKMRHPHPILYWVTFGTPILIGIVHTTTLWTTASANEALHWLVLKTILVALLPTVAILGGLSVVAGVTIYLHSFRTGNRVRVTGGDHQGCTGTVLKYHGFTSPGSVHERLDIRDRDATILPYQIQKICVRWYLL